MNMKFEGESRPQIIFNNEPKLSTYEVDQKFNERRLNLIPYVKDFVSNHDRFKGKSVSISFAEKGVSSLVSIIESSGEKTVLKIRLALSDSGEAHFLKVWEGVGVKVPHVIDAGYINGHEYILMEYIDAKKVGEIYRKGEIIKNEIYVELGQILHTMHTPRAEGYGRFVDGKAEFKEFEEWISCEDVQKHIRYVREHKLLGDEHGSLDAAIEVLKNHVKEENKSVYCHGDFSLGNIFATKPLTIFDPNPRFNDRYMDLGRSIIINIANGKEEVEEQLIKGYFQEQSYDRKVLQAAMLLNAYLKLDYQHKTKSIERMKNISEYLIRTRKFLEE